MSDEQEDQNGASASGEPALDLAGYPDVQSLVRGYRESGAEGKRKAMEADQLRQMNAVLAANQRQDIPQRKSASDELESVGMPVNPMREIVREEIAQAFEPIRKGIEARSTVVARNPDYVKYESEVNQFIQSDPELSQSYNRMFAADPVGAMTYGLMSYADHVRKTTPQEEPQKVAKSAAHAAIPSNRQGDARRVTQGQDSDVAAAWRRLQQPDANKKDVEAYAKARLKTAIPEDFLRQ